MTFFVVFGLSLSAKALVYQGLTNTSLGNASTVIACCISNLGSSGQDGLALVVSNLGSSGQDGVSIALPANLSALDVHYQALDLSNTLPVGAYIQSQTIGTNNGVTNGVLGTITVTKEGTTGYPVSADFSAIGVSNFTVQAYLNGVLVSQATGQNGRSLADGIAWPTSLWYQHGNWGVDWSDGTTNFIGGVAVVCNQLFIIPENGSLASAPTAFQVVASQVPYITITSENESLLYQGLTNTSLGQASAVIACCVSNLSSGGQDGLALVVTNLGSSGQDGISVALPGGLTGLDVHYQALDPSNTLPVGAYLQEQVVGTANGVTNGVCGTVTVTKEGTTNYSISANFSPLGASNYTVQAYFHGVLVAQATDQNEAPLGEAGACISDWDIEISCCPFQWHVTCGWGGSPTSLLMGGASVTCDQLFITPDNVTLGSAPTGLQITASQVPALTITSENESLLYAGLTNTSLGQASAVIACCVSNLGSSGQDGLTLVVTNLGSSGQDGISVALPGGLSALEMTGQPLDVSNTLPVEAYIREQVVGTDDGITNGVLGTVTVEKMCAVCDGSNYIVSADFSAIGANACTVRAYLQGALVGQAAGLNGASLAESGEMCSSWDIEISCCPFQWHVTCGWGGSSTSVTLAGGATLTCDHLLITPEKVPFGSAPTALQITASMVPSLNMTAVAVSPLLVSASQTDQNLTLQWFGTGVLQTSTDLNTWSNLTSVFSPYSISTGGQQGGLKFYRLIFSPR